MQDVFLSKVSLKIPHYIAKKLYHKPVAPSITVLGIDVIIIKHVLISILACVNMHDLFSGTTFRWIKHQ